MYDWYYKDDILNNSAVKNNNGDNNTTYFYKDDVENKMRYISVNVMDYEIENSDDGTVNGKNKTFYYTQYFC